MGSLLVAVPDVDAQHLLEVAAPRISASPSTPTAPSGSTARRRRWIESSNAPDDAGGQRVVRVTHRFHPWFGRELEFVVRRQSWGEDRVCVRDEHGQVRSLPAAWTDVVAADPFVVMAAGRCPFRVTDLLELADLVERLRSGAAQA